MNSVAVIALTLLAGQVGPAQAVEPDVGSAPTDERVSMGEVEPECVTIADCADLDGDLIRDEPCTYWRCEDGQCVGTETVFGDMGLSIAQPGECFANLVTDGGDAGLALNCLFGTSECEDNPPSAFNIDAAGPFSCVPDGVCDLHDVFQALATFGGTGVCSCPGPEPHAPDRTPASHASGNTVRMFMSRDGDEAEAVPSGFTTLFMEPGESVQVMVWLHDRQEGALLTGYQLMFPRDATPLNAATGGVSYVDNNPGAVGGDSVFIDDERTDWVFSDSIAVTVALYPENMSDAFGLAYKTAIPLDDIDPGAADEPLYLGEFELSASPDATGQFEFAPLTQVQMPPRPLTALFAPGGLEQYMVGELQPLRVVIGQPECRTRADCADTDGNNIRDDNCVWWTCNGGLCEPTDIVYGDMGGSFGNCLPDGTADGNDRYHALHCFANSDTNFPPPAGYSCEDTAPPPVYNVDAGSPFGICAADGSCDANDVFHALNAFADETTCFCPLDGAPQPEFEPPVTTTTAHIELRPTRKQLRPGGTLTIEAYLTTPLEDLRGYQLHVGTTGGTRGHLELVDISIDDRRDAAFATATPWSAFNTSTRQMMAGLDTPGVHAPAGSYLATFSFQASDDAVGRFAIDLLADPADNTQRTYLFHTDARVVTHIKTEPVIVEVVSELKRRIQR